MKFIAFDTETTGLSYTNDRIIEFGAVLIEDDIQIDHYSVRINPHIKVNKHAFAVHQISNEMLKDEPSFENVAESIVEFMELGACAIAHNARFDVNFTMQSLWRMKDHSLFDRFGKLTILDTLSYSRANCAGGGNSLDDLADRLNIDRSKRKDIHGALVDSELLSEVIIAIEDKEIIPTDYAVGWTNMKKLKGD